MGTTQIDSLRGLKHEKSRMYDTVLKTIALLPTFELELIDVSPISSSRMAVRWGRTILSGGRLSLGVLGVQPSWLSHSRDGVLVILMLVAPYDTHRAATRS